MSTARSARNKDTGKFSVQCWDWNGKSCFEGEFDTLQEADDAANFAERRMMLAMKLDQDEALPVEQIEAHYAEMTDGELLAEIFTELPIEREG